MKVRPVGAELFDAEGRTDGQKDPTKLRVPLRSFVSVLQKLTLSLQRPNRLFFLLETSRVLCEVRT